MVFSGVEARLATLTLDVDDIGRLSEIASAPETPAAIRERNLAEMAAGLPVLFNTLNARRAIIPAANGHCSARALARYYAALAAAGAVPPSHSSLSSPPLGSHPHLPKFPSPENKPRRKIFGGSNTGKDATAPWDGLSNGSQPRPSAAANDSDSEKKAATFFNSKIHDAFLGLGDYSHLALADGMFGLGFRRFATEAFGHSGIGGSTGFCNVAHDFAIAVTVNKMSLGGITRSIVQLVCSELGVPIPQEFAATGVRGPDMQLSLAPS